MSEVFNGNVGLVDKAFDYSYLYADVGGVRLGEDICLGSSGRGGKKTVIGAPWGQICARYESEWNDTVEMKALYAKKTFLDAGLYYDGYESGKRFSFELPCGYGLETLETEVDFELSYDILRFCNISGGLDKVCLFYLLFDCR